jgi:hypothetical protein
VRVPIRSELDLTRSLRQTFRPSLRYVRRPSGRLNELRIVHGAAASNGHRQKSARSSSLVRSSGTTQIRIWRDDRC